MLTPGPVQTTYNRYTQAAQNGMPANMSDWKADTRIFEEGASPPAGIGFGLAVSQGVGDQGCLLGAPSGHHFVGITRADPTLPNIDPDFTDKYQGGDNVGVAIDGDWWVVTYSDIVAGAAVHFDATTGKLSGSGGVQIANARWQTTATSGNLAVVRLGSAPDHVTAA